MEKSKATSTEPSNKLTQIQAAHAQALSNSRTRLSWCLLNTYTTMYINVCVCILAPMGNTIRQASAYSSVGFLLVELCSTADTATSSLESQTSCAALRIFWSATGNVHTYIHVCRKNIYIFNITKNFTASNNAKEQICRCCCSVSVVFGWPN